jgi:hypothetical protein
MQRSLYQLNKNCADYNFKFLQKTKTVAHKENIKLEQNQYQMDTPFNIFGHNMTFKCNVDMNRKVHRFGHTNSMLTNFDVQELCRWKHEKFSLNASTIGCITSKLL